MRFMPDRTTWIRKPWTGKNILSFSTFKKLISMLNSSAKENENVKRENKNEKGIQDQSDK